MGMFDDLVGTIICPECKKKTRVYEQIKWGDCLLKTLTIGDKLDLPDGECRQATYARPQLFTYCEHCNAKIPFAMKINSGIIKDIYPIQLTEEEIYTLDQEMMNNMLLL